MPVKHMPGITSWSHSKLQDFERCRYRTFLLHVKRVPEPQRPLPPGKTEHANDRGTRVHEAAELYVQGRRSSLAPELKSFENEFNRLRQLYEQGIVSLEGEWGYDKDWQPTEWRSAWHRAKLDIMVRTSETSALVVDIKTGRKDGNELKHGEQLRLYALDTAMRYPDIEDITTELWYVDKDDITSQTFTRTQALKFMPGFKKRGDEITSCESWPANPSIWTCRYCMYGDTGDCAVSAKDMYIKKPGRKW